MIKTWRECHPEGNKIVLHGEVFALMQAEIDELRAALATARKGEREMYKRIGWAQEMRYGKMLLMENDLPKEDLHDNGLPMHELYTRNLTDEG